MTLTLLIAVLMPQGDFEKELDALIPKLLDERIEARDKVKNEIFKLVDAAGPKARAALKARIARNSDAETKSVLLAALGRLPVLELKVQVTGEPKVGGALALKARVRNVSDGEVAVVRVLDGSVEGMRYPKAGAIFHGPDGKVCPVTLSAPMRGDCDLFNEEDVAILKPDEEFDVFKSGSILQLDLWRPLESGKHTLTLTIDYDAPDPAEWNAAPRRKRVDPEKIRKWVALVPRVKLEAKLDFEVKK